MLEGGEHFGSPAGPALGNPGKILIPKNLLRQQGAIRKILTLAFKESDPDSVFWTKLPDKVLKRLSRFRPLFPCHAAGAINQKIIVLFKIIIVLDFFRRPQLHKGEGFSARLNAPGIDGGSGERLFSPAQNEIPIGRKMSRCGGW